MFVRLHRSLQSSQHKHLKRHLLCDTRQVEVEDFLKRAAVLTKEIEAGRVGALLRPTPEREGCQEAVARTTTQVFYTFSKTSVNYVPETCTT